MSNQHRFDAAVRLHQQGRLAEAEPLYRQVLAVDANHLDSLHLLGVLSQQSGRTEEAARLIGKALELKPDWLDAHYNLGGALQAAGRMEAAAASYRRAIALKGDFTEAHNNLGSVLHALGRHGEAETALRRAIALQPGFAEAHCNLGMTLEALGRHDEAVGACRRAIQLKPVLAEAYYNLGVALQAMGRFDEAFGAFARAIAIKPDFPTAWNNLGLAHLNLNRPEDAEAAFRRAVELDPAFVEADSNRLFAFNYMSGPSPEAILAEHRAWDRRHAAALSSPAPEPNRDPERRLRIGYVSPDFYRHSVAYLVVDVLAAHDRGGFEVYCYSAGTQADDMTERLRAGADHWRSLAGLTDEDAADLVRADGIDILIDLAGHTAGNRLLMFARRPAPVQASWMGYPNTTGMAAMDYRIVDAVTDPPGVAETGASEALVRLNGGFLCYACPPDAPEVRPPPCLAGGAITFGSFNNPPKLSDATIHAWAAILARTPGSTLLLKGRQFGEQSVRARMHARFSAHGVGAERLTLLSWIAGTGSHLDAYGRIDIGLDPFPYNGTTTTFEALTMGAPVIALAGDRHVARVGASLLAHAGLDDLVADTPEHYVEIAAALARAPDRLASLRQDLRPRMAASSLGDPRRFTPGLEDALRRMWRRWCAGQPAASFEVKPPSESGGI